MVIKENNGEDGGMGMEGGRAAGRRGGGRGGGLAGRCVRAHGNGSNKQGRSSYS